MVCMCVKRDAKEAESRAGRGARSRRQRRRHCSSAAARSQLGPKLSRQTAVDGLCRSLECRCRTRGLLDSQRPLLMVRGWFAQPVEQLEDLADVLNEGAQPWRQPPAAAAASGVRPSGGEPHDSLPVSTSSQLASPEKPAAAAAAAA